MKIRCLLMFVLSVLCFSLPAQSYQLIRGYRTYTPLENSISLTGGVVWDNEEYEILTDFEFEYFGETFNTFFVSSNGWLAKESDGNITETTGIIPFLSFLVDLGYDSEESLSNISYLIEGDEGDRRMKIEWSNVGFYDDLYYPKNRSFANFQIWIYEVDNSIEFHYGPSQINDAIDFSYFGGGPFVALRNKPNINTEEFDELLVLAGDPALPDVIVWNGSLDDFNAPGLLQGAPPENQIYRFNFLPVSTKEIEDHSRNFALQPNPVSSNLNIVAKDSAHDIESVSIFNNDGRQLKTLTSNFSNIDVADLSNGVYHVNIYTKDGLAVKRFVKVD